ncbi:LysM peptidoglycan-binding domain-containing protein [Niallia sp. Krafla_26]|uniref:C40 family peptidase n=1 Tax=Niallia sp. Krafla_26 TaxID=3064703 RepID=UPI003D1805D0
MKKQIFSAVVALGIMSSFTNQADAHEKTHTVKPGETLWRISQNHNLTTQDLMQYNNLSSSTIYVGQTISLLAPHSHDHTYTVRSGDTLYSIANKHNTSVSNLKSANNLSTNLIHVGQVLTIPNGTQSTSTSPSTSSYTYTVKSGDTLWRIANNHGLSVTQLKSYNQLTNDTIHVGQVLHLTSGTTSSPAPAPNVSSSFNADALIAEGKKYMGVPYKWGGNTPAGFDCSGFLKYVYNTQGITIPRTVATIWDATKAVSSPQKGDIVFFTTYKAGPSHAGIYLGNNKFLHAGTSTGVTISDLNNSYWKPRYLGAKSVK